MNIILFIDIGMVNFYRSKLYTIYKNNVDLKCCTAWQENKSCRNSFALGSTGHDKIYLLKGLGHVENVPSHCITLHLQMHK